jgi:hypothetical protein
MTYYLGRWKLHSYPPSCNDLAKAGCWHKPDHASVSREEYEALERDRALKWDTIYEVADE